MVKKATKGEDKNFRLLDIFVKLQEGKTLKKADMAEEYKIDQRSVQRDIHDLKKFLDEKASGSDAASNLTLIYDRQSVNRGYRLEGKTSTMLSNSEALAVSKILLESRAFSKAEIDKILDNIISGCVDKTDLKMVKALVSKDKLDYRELHPYQEEAVEENAEDMELPEDEEDKSGKRKKANENKLWDIALAISRQEVMEIKYKKTSKDKAVKRFIVPMQIMFSQYYFYVRAYLVKKEDKEQRSGAKYVKRFDHLTTFRVDRITSCKGKKERMRLEYSDRPQDSISNLQSMYMFDGDTTKLQFKYYGTNADIVRDRYPEAELKSQDENSMLFELKEVHWQGMLLWLLSQGSNVEVIKPKDKRQEFIAELKKMMERYE